MKLLPFLALILLVPSSHGQEKPRVGQVLQSVERLAENGSKKATASESGKLVVGTERIRFFDGSELRGAMLKLEKTLECAWMMESWSKPLRGISTYTVRQLQAMAERAGLRTTDAEGKRLRKGDLYAALGALSKQN